LQGTYTYVLQTEDGQISTTHSISAGLDYPAIGPEHAWLADQRRAEYSAVSDAAALDAAQRLARTEGIIPALESAHAIAGLIERIGSSDAAGAPPAGIACGSSSVTASQRLTANDLVIVNLSGRGDKDMATYSRVFDE
jgi:tryptophan synthase beta chain